MEGSDLARLGYLALLALAVGGWFLSEHRGGMGRALRQAMVWGFLFLGVIAGFGLWQDIRRDHTPRATLASSGTIEIPRGLDGHYRLTLDVGGTPVDFIVDTGATSIVLSRADAARIGVDLDALVFSGRANTANGTVATAPIRLPPVSFGPHRDENLRAQVNGGELDVSLLGMSYLQRFQRLEIASGVLRLER